ncbi:MULTISPECIES: family 1 glycosylhydrolase [Sphingosinicellaceae]|uniref:family 1 glycosylhydrolase n=1 Tax=Sphingosinicellaceae TaxID=2820280 RepID=UPI001C1E5825|nr:MULTISPECIES: family 1 glycosylhydrolase [Polymorphobacter]QYE35662.1 family 1 glycosylhydrolase [Polymorphobacter sp. PAMC 29334]UAJ10972.1 family 1 glycosylhydrolase [Polymorphobacter megasporae]
MPKTFMFATGIENSNPTINGGRTRIDELESCGHYRYWKTDIDLVQEMCISYLRYGPPLHRTWLGDGRYDWEFADLAFAEIYRKNIVAIVDLCHFGLPDWLGNFQNSDFPKLFARYAADFATRYPFIQFYTPVNEMFICALFSAKYGWWNEEGVTDQTFVTALKNLVRANVLAMRAILKVRPDAIFIQSESSEYFHAEGPSAIAKAEMLNSMRFLSLDLNYGTRVDSGMYHYLADNGMSRDEYDFFMNQRLKPHCIMGNDYYWTNEHRVMMDGNSRASGEVIGYDAITKQYYERYRLPVMHTETNFNDGADGEGAVDWLWKQWANVLRVRNDGVPILGFTWYSLTDQVDWDSALRETNGNVNPVGLFDLNRNIRPVGKAYKHLMSQWCTVLPTQSMCLVVPTIWPQEYDEPHARRQRADALEYRTWLDGSEAGT